MSAPARRLLELYRGREGVYAELNGHWSPVEGELTEIALEAHVTGARVLGVYLVRKDNSVYFGSGEFDNEVDPASTLAPARRLRAKLVELGVPEEATLLSFSGHKGHHLDVFVSSPINAGTMRRAIDIASVLANLEEHEIFPKQDAVDVDGYGNLLKLPLCIHPKTRRKAEILDHHVVKPCDPTILHHIVREHAKVQRRATADKKAEPPQKTYGEGERHDRIVELAGRLNSEGVSLEAAELACLDENRNAFDPIAAEDYILEAVRDVYRRYADQHRQGPAKRGGSIGSRTAPDAVVEALIGAGTLKPKPISWIWKNRIARGKMTVAGGDPGGGKSMLSVDWAARMSTGRKWPDGTQAPMCKSALVSAEDDPQDTIVPRLIAQQADLAMIVFPGPLDLSTGADAFFDSCMAAGVEVVFIDPISAFVGPDINTWRDSDMRRFLKPIAAAAARTNCAVVLIVHLTKANGTKALYRFQGSIAQAAAPRMAFLIAAHPNDPEVRVMAAVKNNIGQKAESLSYRIASTYVAEVEDDIGRVEWLGVVALSDAELLQPENESKALDRAEEFLLEALAKGPQPSEEIFKQAKARKVGVNACWDAKKKLGIVAKKDGLERWLWTLPSPRIEPSRPDRDASLAFSSNPPPKSHTNSDLSTYGNRNEASRSNDWALEGDPLDNSHEALMALEANVPGDEESSITEEALA